MKKLLLTTIISLISVATFAQTPSDPTQNPTDCANAFFKSMLDEDAGLMRKVLADDFSIVSFDGASVDRDLILQALEGGYVATETGVTTAMRTRTYNDNAAVVTCNWKAKGSIQGNGFDTEVAVGVVCVKVGGTWKISNVQFTPFK